VEVVLEDRDGVVLTVRDTGCGIRRDLLPYIFERFTQADTSTTRVHAGLGIGLTIVKHIVEAHGGTVTADSPGEGHGATFTVSLPVAQCDEQRPDAGGGGVQGGITGGVT